MVRSKHISYSPIPLYQGRQGGQRVTAGVLQMDRIVPAVLVSKSEPSFQSSASKGFIFLKAESKATPGSSVSTTHAFLQFSTPASTPSSCDDSPMPTVPYDGWGDSSCRMHRWAQRIRADFLIQGLHLQAAGSAAPVPLLLGMEVGAYSKGP